MLYGHQRNHMLIFAWGIKITETTPVHRTPLGKNEKGCVIWDGKFAGNQVYQSSLFLHLVSGFLGVWGEYYGEFDSSGQCYIQLEFGADFGWVLLC